MNKPLVKRRRLLIKKPFQARLILGALGLILLSSLCSALLIYWITGGDLAAQSHSAHASLMNAWQRLGLSILIGNAIAILIVGATGLIKVLYLSHRIAGPLYRFEVLCKDVGNGNLDTITRLRDKDHLQDLAKAFLDMVTKLRDRQILHLDLVTQLENQLNQLAEVQNLNPDMVGKFAELHSVINQLRDSLDGKH